MKRAEEIQAEIARLKQESDDIAALEKKYPDLKREVGRWNRVRFYSKAIWDTMEGVSYYRTCGCCTDAGVIVYGYVREGQYEVQTEGLCIGEREYWESGWRRKLKDAGFKDHFIEKLAKWEPERSRDDYDRYGEDSDEE